MLKYKDVILSRKYNTATNYNTLFTQVIVLLNSPVPYNSNNIFLDNT